MTKLAKGTLSYTKKCPRCGTYVKLTTDELNFDGVTVVHCPTCDLAIRFTGDLGFVGPEIKTEHEKQFKEINDDKCRQNPADE